MLRFLIGLLVLLTFQIGCTESRTYQAPRVQDSRLDPNYQPRLRYSDADIDRRLVESEGRQQRRNQAPPGLTQKKLKFEAVVRELDRFYRRGATDSAQRIFKQVRQSQLRNQIVDFDDPISRQTIEIQAHFRRFNERGGLYVRITRKKDFKGPIAVAFPPGTLARPYVPPTSKSKFGRWPTPGKLDFSGEALEQDLVPLAARIAWLDANVDTMTVRFPVSCGRFSKAPPKDGQEFFMLRNDSEAQLSKLLGEICSIYEISLDHPAAQMAIWLVRDDISYRQFRNAPGAVTFETGERIRESAADDAVEIMLDAGIDPRELRYFKKT